jgi:DNA-binding NtrC family response regulator
MAERSVQQLATEGDLRQAADLLDAKERPTLPERALRASIEFQIGDPANALKLAEALLAQTVDPRTRIRALAVKGRSLGRLGSTAQSVGLLQKAIAQAAQVDTALEAELRADFVHDLLSLVGIEPTVAELPRLRESALKSGNRQALAKFHLANARVEALRSPSCSVSAQLEMADSLLVDCPNSEIRWFVQHVRTGIAIMDGDSGGALVHARECLKQARESNTKSRIGYALGNLANILVNTGAFAEARQALDECLDLLPNSSLARFAALHTGLHLSIITEDEMLARRMIDDGSRTAQLADCERSYYRLWFEFHRLKWLSRHQRADEVLPHILNTKDLAERLADKELSDRLLLLAAEACARDGQSDKASAFVHQASSQWRVTLPYLAELYRVAGVCESDANFRRGLLGSASRILAVAGLHGLQREVELTATSLGVVLGDREPSPMETLQHLGLLLHLGPHPSVIGQELCALLSRTKACRWACVVAHKGSSRMVVGQTIQFPDVESKASYRVLLGTAQGVEYWLYSADEGAATHILSSALQQIARGAQALHERSNAANRDDTAWFANTIVFDSGMVAAADKSLELLKTTRKLAPSNITVLITGETGTGKELFARALHDASPRRDKPFIPFNCSAVSKEMLDAQLFGYRRGAFTGATEAFPGVIRAAAGGTLFLDEIGEVALDVQPKLLRFLESGEIHPLGEARPMPVDVRVVAATNADLEHMVDEGRFREDLFYRLNVVRLHVPPLRERREEIPPLVQHYLDKCSRESHKTGLRVADETIEYLILYRWPGNVRQLANEIRRMVALAETNAVLMPEHLSADIAASRRTVPASERPLAPTEFVVRVDQPMSAAMEHLERSMIQYALRLSGGRLEDAAERLGLSRKGLYLKRQRLALLDAEADRQSTMTA